jgi:hypothetical protein
VSSAVPLLRTSPGQVNNQQRARRRGTTMIACCESSKQRAGGVAVSLRNIPEDKVGLLLLLGRPSRQHASEYCLEA